MSVAVTVVVETDVVRCFSCGKALAMGATWAGELKIVCPRCKRINHLRAVSPNPEPHDGLSRPQGGNYAPSHPAR
ncbi:Com family DNA-binding transcriptional regulator [Desulfovibrio piger]|nr:Com family DNA-binding transcriptional regulator [Desulfovibrio piger]